MTLMNTTSNLYTTNHRCMKSDALNVSLNEVWHQHYCWLPPVMSIAMSPFPKPSDRHLLPNLSSKYILTWWSSFINIHDLNCITLTITSHLVSRASLFLYLFMSPNTSTLTNPEQQCFIIGNSFFFSFFFFFNINVSWSLWDNAMRCMSCRVFGIIC